MALLYLTTYLPLALMAYSPQWYRLNCHWHPRCERIGMATAERGIGELTRYFRHQGTLEHRWTAKEQRHLAEVRSLYDRLFWAALIAAVLLAATYRRERIAYYALVNAVIVAALLLALPFFKTFWRELFHPVLFDNELWRNNRYDLSYYITPRVFFLYSTAALVASSIALNLGIWLLLRRQDQGPQPESPADVQGSSRSALKTGENAWSESAGDHRAGRPRNGQPREPGSSHRT